jgi:hypothetical protein
MQSPYIMQDFSVRLRICSMTRDALVGPSETGTLVFRQQLAFSWSATRTPFFAEKDPIKGDAIAAQ